MKYFLYFYYIHMISQNYKNIQLMVFKVSIINKFLTILSHIKWFTSIDHKRDYYKILLKVQ